jgi:hypothetical protein
MLLYEATPIKKPKKLDVFQILCLMHFVYKLFHCSVCIVNSQLSLKHKMSNIYLHCPVCTVSSELCIWPVNWFVCWTQTCLKTDLTLDTGVGQTDD